jgi:chromosome segregation ATPase
MFDPENLDDLEGQLDLTEAALKSLIKEHRQLRVVSASYKAWCEKAEARNRVLADELEVKTRENSNIKDELGAALSMEIGENMRMREVIKELRRQVELLSSKDVVQNIIEQRDAAMAELAAMRDMSYGDIALEREQLRMAMNLLRHEKDLAYRLKEEAEAERERAILEAGKLRLELEEMKSPAAIARAEHISRIINKCEEFASSQAAEELRAQLVDARAKIAELTKNKAELNDYWSDTPVKLGEAEDQFFELRQQLKNGGKP